MTVTFARCYLGTILIFKAGVNSTGNTTYEKSSVKRVIFLFLDGVGLGADDPTINPLAAATYPALQRLLSGHKAVATTGRLSTALAELVPNRMPTWVCLDGRKVQRAKRQS